jgi:uncharacterized protein
MRPGLCILVVGSLLLAGCASSPPSKFYRLTTVPPSGASPSASPAAPSIRVAAVHIPPMLDRQEIARTSADNQLEVSGLDRWDAPLDEMVQQILTRDLMDRLPAGKVILPGAPAPAGVDLIVVNILQFQSDVSGSVVFQGSWALLPPNAVSPAVIRDFRYGANASPQDLGDEVGSMSTLLGQLADDIASHLPVH